MHWIKTDITTATKDLSNRLLAELMQGKTALWLISGGSNIQTASNVLAAIPDEYTSNLLIMPVDERYGEPGHADSNWQQFISTVGSTKSAMLYPVLLPGRSLEESKQFFSDVFNAAYRRSDASIALLGMGTDGHIAGILPNSVAANESQELVAAYQSEPYQRLTLTFPALRMLTGVYTFAFGDGKNEALTILQEQTLPVTEQPAQFLKELPDSYLYNDQKGEKV